jgi:hypothetical protein
MFQPHEYGVGGKDYVTGFGASFSEMEAQLQPNARVAISITGPNIARVVPGYGSVWHYTSA